MRASILAAYALITTVLWVLRVWVLHALDVALAYARGQRSERKRNIYLQGDTRGHGPETLLKCALRHNCTTNGRWGHVHLLNEPQQQCPTALLRPVCLHAGKYKPVKDEVTCTDLEVEGKMPTAMFGCAHLPACFLLCDTCCRSWILNVQSVWHVTWKTITRNI